MKLNNKTLSLIFLLPVLLFYIAHFFHPKINPNHVATGFVQYDQPYYVINSLEYKKDSSSFPLTFALPYESQLPKDKIYFFPQIFAIGYLLKITSINPTFLFLLFGFVFGYLAILQVLKIIDYLTTEFKINKPILVKFLAIWGGGLLFLAGFFYSLFQHHFQLGMALKNSFIFDPGDGWWMLNVGRNFIYPMEAFYHFLVFSTVLFILKKQHIKAALLAGFTMLCHPFTGVIIAAATGSFFLLQYLKNKNKNTLISLCIVGVSGCWLIAYNFLILPQNASHKALMNQWTINWSAPITTFLLAYTFVIVSALLSLKNKWFTLKNEFGWFLLCWLITNVSLENHQYFIKPHQPLHFSHGYVWFCLFLMGLPALIHLTNNLKNMYLYAISMVFVADNVTWFSLKSMGQLFHGGIYLTQDEYQTLQFLKQPNNANFVVSENEKIAYFNLYYSNNSSYTSHVFNTPNIADKQKIISQISQGDTTQLKKFPLHTWGVFDPNSKICSILAKEKLIFRNNSYNVYYLH